MLDLVIVICFFLLLLLLSLSLSSPPPPPSSSPSSLSLCACALYCWTCCDDRASLCFGVAIVVCTFVCIVVVVEMISDGAVV